MTVCQCQKAGVVEQYVLGMDGRVPVYSPHHLLVYEERMVLQ